MRGGAVRPSPYTQHTQDKERKTTMPPTLLYRLIKNSRRGSHPKADLVGLAAVVETPAFVELTDDDGIKVCINANHIITMMPFTLRHKQYTKVEREPTTTMWRRRPRTSWHSFAKLREWRGEAMPCKIPSHIFDIDDATAERLTRIAIRRRKSTALLRLGLSLSTIALAGLAVASTI